MAQGDTLGVVMQSDIGSGASGGVAAQAQISGIFSATSSYAVGDYVVYNGLLYRCTTAHSGAWDASHFEQVTIGGELNTRTPVYGGGVNLLDNWYFIGGGSQQGGGQFPINQRRQTSYSGTGYGIDRWISLFAAITANLTANGLSIVNSGTAAGNIVQRLPGLSKYLGKTYTASILLSGGVLATATFSVPATASGTVLAGLVYFTGGRVEVGYNTEKNWLYFSIVVNANTTVTIEAVKLELGDTQTLARNVGGNWVLNDPPPDFVTELMKCQQYMLVFSNNSGSVGYLGFGRMEGSTSARIKILTPTRMFKNPELTGSIELQMLNSTAIQQVTALSGIWNPDATGVYFMGTVSEQTAGTFFIVRLGLGQSLILDANI